GSPAAGRAGRAGLSSLDPSSTTISSQTSPLGWSAARTSSTKRARFAASSCAGTTTLSVTPGVIEAFWPIEGGRSSDPPHRLDGHGHERHLLHRGPLPEPTRA